MAGYCKLSMLTLLVGGFIHLHDADAGTIQAASCSQDDVQKAVDAATDGEGVTGYYVWLDGAQVSAITDPTYTQYTFLRLKPPMEQHTFRISAFDAAGNESEPSSPARTGEL